MRRILKRDEQPPAGTRLINAEEWLALTVLEAQKHGAVAAFGEKIIPLPGDAFTNYAASLGCTVERLTAHEKRLALLNHVIGGAMDEIKLPPVRPPTPSQEVYIGIGWPVAALFGILPILIAVLIVAVRNG